MGGVEGTSMRKPKFTAPQFKKKKKCTVQVLLLNGAGFESLAQHLPLYISKQTPQGPTLHLGPVYMRDCSQPACTVTWPEAL